MPILESIVGSKIYGFGNPGSLGAFESIASTTLLSDTSGITFSSIPSTYQHLQIRAMIKDAYTPGSGVTSSGIQFNSDSTGSNYKIHYLEGNGSSVSSTNGSTYVSVPYIPYGYTNTFGVFIVDIHDYASTTKRKVSRTFMGVDVNAAPGNPGVGLQSSVWMSTSPITSIRIFSHNTNLLTGSIVSLYGIRGA